MALTELEFVEKMKAGTATVEEAISFARSRPTISPNAKKRIGALTSGFKKMGLDITMPYKDLKDDKVLTLFTKENSPDKSNRAPNLQALENNIKGLFDKYAISGVMEKVPGSDIEVAMYPQLTGTGTVAGTQRTGMAGERPMRGLLPMEDFAKMYAEAVPLIQAEYGQATADLAKYHATTSHRPSQLQGLKKSDVTVSNNTITVAGKKVTKTDKKGRPPLTFDLDSPTGQLLKRNLDSTKSEFLFDTSTANFDDAFAKHITPRLEQYSKLLPLAEIKVEGPDGIRLSKKPVTTPSAIRSIVPKIMLDQYNIPEALIQGVMGHVNASILRKNYAGLAPSTDIPKLLENPSSFAVGDFGTTQKNINLDLLSDEDKALLIEDQKKTIQAEEQARQATARTTIAEAEVAEIKAKGSVTPEDIAKAEQIDEELIRAKTRKKIKEREIAADERSRARIDPAKQDPMAAMTPEGVEKLKELGIWEKISAAIPGPVKKALGPLGIGLSAVAAQSTYSRVSEAATKAGVPEPLSQAAGALAGASEFAPITFSDVEAVAEARVSPDMFGMTGASRVAADMQSQEDVDDEGRPAGSTTSLRDVESSLQLNRKPKAVPEVNQSFLDMQPQP